MRCARQCHCTDELLLGTADSSCVIPPVVGVNDTLAALDLCCIAAPMLLFAWGARGGQSGDAIMLLSGLCWAWGCCDLVLFVLCVPLERRWGLRCAWV